MKGLSILSKLAKVLPLLLRNWETEFPLLIFPKVFSVKEKPHELIRGRSGISTLPRLGMLFSQTPSCLGIRGSNMDKPILIMLRIGEMFSHSDLALKLGGLLQTSVAAIGSLLSLYETI
jgi:hypothetical protein